MHSVSFLLAAIAYAGLTVFIFFSYPASWRKNRMFIAVLLLWHLLGLTAVTLIFTVFRHIRFEGFRHEIARIGTCYYIVTTIQAALFLIHAVSVRTYLFIKERTQKAVPQQQRHILTDKRIHSVVILVLSFLVFAVGYFNIDFLHETRYEVEIPANSQQKELTICLIADIHAGSGTWEYTYDDLAELIDRSEPDVLLIAGDVFDETTNDADIANVAWTLRNIQKPRYGMYFVYGNHDSSIEDWAAEQMRSMGVTVLKDEMTVIGEDIQLIGRMDPVHTAKSVETLMRDCAPDPDKPILVLTHRPKDFAAMAASGCDLAMAGHTHGFNIPQFLGANMLGDMYYGSKAYDGMTAITTSGVSAWGYHYKWPAVSEVVTVHLTFTGAE